MESTHPLIKFSCAPFQLILPPLSLATFWLPSLWTSKKENCSAFTYLCLLSFTQHVFGSIQGVLKTCNNKNKNMGMSLFWFLQVPLLFLTLFLHYAPPVLFPVDAVLCSHTLLHSIPYSSLLIAKESSISRSAIAPSHALSMSLQLLHELKCWSPSTGL